MKILGTTLLLLALATGLPALAERVANGFDSPAALEKLRQPDNIKFCPDKKVAGAGCVAIECMFKGGGHNFPLPKGSTQGVLTFWFYDPVFPADHYFLSGVDVSCEKLVDGKKQGGGFSLFSGDTLWQLHDSRKMQYGGDEHGRKLYVAPHGGWTRFDIVAPAGEGPRQFEIYIDGRPAGKTVEKYTALTGAGAGAKWGGGTVYFDELSFDSDPAAFKPNVVRDIVLGDEAARVKLSAGEKLKVHLGLDKRGVTASGGAIEVKLLDGAEREVSTKTVDYDGEDALDVALPTPPCSGRYWISATYKDKKTALPLAAVEKFDVQFYPKGQPQDDSIVCGKAWDFLPVGPKAPAGKNIDCQAPPATPPTDWSQAIPLKGAWYHMGRLREFSQQCGWYHRLLDLPADWKGRKIQIDIEDVQTLATVYVDGHKLGDVEWPGGSLDITKAVTPGKTIDLAIFVRAEVFVGVNKVMRDILGEAYNPTENISMRGLRGPVTFRASPLGPAVDHAAIHTPAKALEVDYALTGLKPGESYTLAGVVSTGGKPALTLPVQTFTAKAPAETVTVKAPWDASGLWDFHKPFFHDLSVTLSGGGKVLDAPAPVRFGARDFAFKGNRVTLNGRNVNLFQPMVISFFTNPGFAKFMRDMNYNSFTTSHYNFATSLGAGNAGIRDFADFCGGAGLGGGINLTAPYLDSQLVSFNKENDPRYWDYSRKLADYIMRQHGNNPGVLFWVGPAGGNTIGMGAMYNPYLQDGLWQRDNTDNQQRQRLTQVERRSLSMLKTADPSRPVVAQDSGNFTDACHITQYAGFTPMQELIEMNSYWREHGKKPLFYSEHGAPFMSNWFTNPRDGGHGAKKLIPYFAEWCSITHGDDAFVRDSLDSEFLERFEKLSKDRYAAIYKIEDKARRDQALADYSNGTWPPSPASLYDGTDNARNRLWLERIRENYLNLRADGLGEICPWTGGLNPKDYCKYFAPVLAFISGAPGDRYDKTHVFAPGETLSRGVTVVSNDARPRKVRCDWKLTLGGEIVASKSVKLEVPPGETVTIPISVRVKVEKDCSGTLSMVLFGDGKKLCDDSVAIDVLAPRPFANDKNIALIDPEGDSAKALKRAGIKFDLVPLTMDLSPYDVVVFGRRAFLYELANTPEGFDLDALTRAGKKVVVLEQAESTLRDRFKFRTEYVSPRVVFNRALSDGLPDSCLNFWRGSSTLTDGYEVARAQLTPRPQEMNGGRWFYTWNDGTEHPHPMKWGNHHNVATVVVYKPDTGSFRTLVDCEFGLYCAAAWQLDNAAGQVVFSQLDVSGRDATGPEAVRYLQNLIDHAAKLPQPVWKQATYLGGDDGAALLTSLFVPFRRVASPDAAAGVLVLGEATPAELKAWAPALAKFVTDGGVVFSLPKTAEQLSAGWLPVPVAPEKKMVNATAVGKGKDPLLSGLGSGDFFWRGNVAITSPGKLPGADLQFDTGVLTRLPQGKGSWALCQISPALFGSEDYFWLKDSRRNTERALRSMLSNLGVEMNAPLLLRRPKASKETLLNLPLTGAWEVAKADGDSPEAKPGAWKPLDIPGDFRKVLPELNQTTGAVWFRRSFDLTAAPSAGMGARLFLGSIRGIDFTFVNGKRVGNTDRITNPNDLSTATRDYQLPAGLLKQGRNELSVLCVFDTRPGLSPGDGNLVPPLFLELFKERSAAVSLEPVELGGWWRGYACDSGKSERPADTDKNWHRIKLPGSYQEQHAHWGAHLGYFWCKRSFVLAEKPPAGATPMLSLGAVDDEDDTYLNGKLLGHIGKDTNPKNYYSAERCYPIPEGLLKVGENTVEVRINNTFLNGGVVGPIRLLFEDPKVAAERKLAASPYLHDVDKTDDPYMYCGW